MKFFFAFAFFAAVTTALPTDSKNAGVIRYENDNIGIDNYKFLYETEDGKSAQESGVLKNAGTENEAMEIRGFFSYPGPDGVTYSVQYIANENGFQPSAVHLPVAPKA